MTHKARDQGSCKYGEDDTCPALKPHKQDLPHKGQIYMRCDECRHFTPLGQRTGYCKHIVKELWFNKSILEKNGSLGVLRKWFCGFYMPNKPEPTKKSSGGQSRNY